MEITYVCSIMFFFTFLNSRFYILTYIDILFYQTRPSINICKFILFVLSSFLDVACQPIHMSTVEYLYLHRHEFTKEYNFGFYKPMLWKFCACQYIQSPFLHRYKIKIYCKTIIDRKFIFSYIRCIHKKYGQDFFYEEIFCFFRQSTCYRIIFVLCISN